jgi:hypothetical protein
MSFYDAPRRLTALERANARRAVEAAGGPRAVSGLFICT